MKREVYLLKYLPPFMQEFKQLNEVMQAESPELQSVFNQSESIKDNQFIMSCDLLGISKFEMMLGLVPTLYDDLQARRQKVLRYWMDFLPYTHRSFLNKMYSIYGEDNIEVEKNFHAYQLFIAVNTSEGKHLDYSDFYQFIAQTIPANIDFRLHALDKSRLCFLGDFDFERFELLKGNVAFVNEFNYFLQSREEKSVLFKGDFNYRLIREDTKTMVINFDVTPTVFRKRLCGTFNCGEL